MFSLFVRIWFDEMNFHQVELNFTLFQERDLLSVFSVNVLHDKEIYYHPYRTSCISLYERIQ